MAIVAAIQRWKGYLMNKPFVIKTDHQALKFMLEQKECNPTLQKWLSKLLGLQYTVLYQKGCENQVVDALSRSPEVVQYSAISSVMNDWMGQIQDSVQMDGKLQGLQGLIDAIKETPSVSNKYQVLNGVLTRKGKLVVGDDKALQTKLIAFFHASAVGGHSGIHATNQRLSRVLYWKGMQAHVRHFVSSCKVCQQCKYDK